MFLPHFWCPSLYTVNGQPATCPSGHLQYCNRKIPSGPKGFFSIYLQYKRDVCKTLDRTSPTPNKVSYYSFYFQFLIKIFPEGRGALFICVTSSQCKVYGPSGNPLAGWTLMCMCNGLPNAEPTLRWLSSS